MGRTNPTGRHGQVDVWAAGRGRQDQELGRWPNPTSIVISHNRKRLQPALIRLQCREPDKDPAGKSSNEKTALLPHGRA